MSMIRRLAEPLVKRGRVTLILPGGERETLGPGGGEDVVVRLTDRAALAQLVRHPRLKLGELYMDGRLVIEQGTMLDLLRIIVGSNPWEDGGKRGKTAMTKRGFGFVKRMFKSNKPTKARQNVAHHYDLDDGLYDLFLDPWRQYSCAYFPAPDIGLDEAQRLKLAHIAAKLDLRPGQRVLDIGCGWGGLGIYLHQVAGVDVLGVTLSVEQHAYAEAWATRAGVSDHVKFALIDYRHVTDSFDRIVSVGMFEHVGAAHYDEFYAHCSRLLADDGVMLLHTIGKLGGSGKPDPFTDKWIFPGYHVPSLAQMGSSSEKARMIVSDVEVLRLHYGLTLQHWLDRCAARRAEIVAIYDERFYRMWEFYLAGALVMFESGTGCNFQVQYVRSRRALPITRDYMAETEQEFRARVATPVTAKPKRARVQKLADS